MLVNWIYLLLVLITIGAYIRPLYLLLSLPRGFRAMAQRKYPSKWDDAITLIQMFSSVLIIVVNLNVLFGCIYLMNTSELRLDNLSTKIGILSFLIVFSMVHSRFINHVYKEKQQ